MTPHEIALVRAGFAQVVPMAEQAALLFYERLFVLDPQLRAMFRSPLPEQGRKLMAALGMVVAALDRMEVILPAVERLAVGHLAYGVRPEHYATVGAALIWTLRTGLGTVFTQAAEEAWTEAYRLLSGAMIAAAGRVDGGEGQDVIYGGAGNDTADSSTGGNDIYHGGSGNDFFFGYSGNEQLFGDSGDDTLLGFSGKDALEGGSGADSIGGGDGVDTVTFASSTEGVMVLLQEGLGAGGAAEGDTYLAVENATGSAWDDLLYGDTGANKLVGGGGGDFLMGRAGDDRLEGGSGSDTLIGNEGKDVLRGGEGSDSVDYLSSKAAVQVDIGLSTAAGGDAAGDTISSIENATGSSYADRLIGSGMANALDGGTGKDTLTGLGGDDLLIGGRDGDALDGSDGSDTVSYATATAGVSVSLLDDASGFLGDAAGDVLRGVENLAGSRLSDALGGSDSANRLDGAAGDDVLTGFKGADILVGGSGLDTFVFRSTPDSGTSASTRDHIADFSVGDGDLIDLHLIDADTGHAGDEAFSYIGDGAFTAVGQVRAIYDGENTVIEVNTGGSLSAEMRIQLDGEVALSSFDFIL